MGSPVGSAGATRHQSALGLATVAALCPSQWYIEIVDEKY